MFRNCFQKLRFSLFYSAGRNPLLIWKLSTEHGYAKRILDEDINCMVLEIVGINISTTYMVAPKEPNFSLGIRLPILVMLLKNMQKYFTFEIKILDDTQFPRRIRISNLLNKTVVDQLGASMPLRLSPGWNQVNFNLAEFTRLAYGTNYSETMQLQINANVRIRRIYFTERLYTDDKLPNEYRLKPRPTRKPLKPFNSAQQRLDNSIYSCEMH